MQKKIVKNQPVVESARSLWLDFERHLDAGRMESGARKFQSDGHLPPSWVRMGEGADQVVIGPAHAPYVVCLPKHAFLEQLGKGGREWLASVSLVAREARQRLMEADFVTLVPPMSVMANPSGLIMAKGTPRFNGVPPMEIVENTRTLLKDLGLALEDSPQCALAGDGVWFIHDWSDLRGKAKASSQALDSSISF
ncbi:MAG: hypothetical protein RIQ81_564 [Pseudomonadota bacterium]